MLLTTNMPQFSAARAIISKPPEAVKPRRLWEP
jgi:hypothetical protein